MNVEETDLPGLGRRKDFMTASGRRIGVVELREGQTELVRLHLGRSRHLPGLDSR